MVFCGLFPIDTDRYEDLRDALDKMGLNDAALSWEPETSEALGFGFRCGFLGLLHMEIVRERLEREYGLELMATSPTVRYEVHLTNGETIEISSPNQMPDPGSIEPDRGALHPGHGDHPDRLRRAGDGALPVPARRPRGHGLPQPEPGPDPLRPAARRDRPRLLRRPQVLDQGLRLAGLRADRQLRASELVKVDVLLAGEKVDALSIITHREFAYTQGKDLVARLRKTIPRQQFDIPVQAAIGANILARETVKAVRKDVTAKLYGGDVTRKNKLLEKQKKGKKRMKNVGRVEVPQEAFLAVLELDD